MDKKTLRAMIREKKQALTPAQIEQASAELAGMLFAHPYWQQAKTVYGYLSYNQEVRTLPILQRALDEGKSVAVPKVFGSQMRFIRIDSLRDVAPGYRGIPEPIADGPCAQDETALILMPGLAFDAQGRRCGYGGGFYDRYLAEHRQHRTLALCYDFQMLDSLPCEEFDVPTDVVLSVRVEDGL